MAQYVKTMWDSHIEEIKKRMRHLNRNIIHYSKIRKTYKFAYFRDRYNRIHCYSNKKY